MTIGTNLNWAKSEPNMKLFSIVRENAPDIDRARKLIEEEHANPSMQDPWECPLLINVIKWKIGENFRFTTLRNILYPWMSWESEDSLARAETDEPNKLWPLKVGNSGRLQLKNFFNKFKGTHPLEYREELDCTVQSTANIKVLAGSFDTYKIRCHRYIEQTVFTETSFLYYAPKVGYFVKEVYLTGFLGKSSRQLASFGVSTNGLSAEDRKQIDRHFQTALGTKKSGNKSSWTSVDGKRRSTIIPTATFIMDDGQVCRNYSRTLLLEGREREWDGRACRGDQGHWKAP